MQPALWLPFGVCLIGLPALLIAEYRPTRWVVLPLKMACSLCFIALGILGIVLGERQALGYDILMMVGLVFSLLGDLALVWNDERRFFLLGLGAFLVTQVLYGTAFSIFNGFSGWDILLFSALFFGPMVAYRFLEMDIGGMKTPVLLYLLVIAFMLTKALSSLYLKGIPEPAQGLVVCGAALFYLSDAFLALYRFQRKPVNAFRAVNLTTYYIGQMLLALSLYYF